MKHLRKVLYVVAVLSAIVLTSEQAMSSNFDVKVKRGRLSVSADNANFGSLMNQIAKDAGFEVSVSPDVAVKTLTTDFRDLELENGIQRLMGLIRHRNFFMFYGRDGEIKKIEIYGSRSGGSSGMRTSRPAPGTGMTPMVLDPPPGSEGSSSNADSDRIKGVPYIPPTSIPEFIPPRRGLGSGK